MQGTLPSCRRLVCRITCRRRLRRAPNRASKSTRTCRTWRRSRGKLYETFSKLVTARTNESTTGKARSGDTTTRNRKTRARCGGWNLVRNDRLVFRRFETRVRWDRKRSSCPGVVVTKGQRGQKNTTLRGFEETAKPWKSEGSRHCLIFPSLFRLLRLSVAVSVRSSFPWLRRVPSRSFTRLALLTRDLNRVVLLSSALSSCASVDDRRQNQPKDSPRFPAVCGIPLNSSAASCLVQERRRLEKSESG